MKIKFVCNSENISLDVPAGKPALDIIRRDIGFTGCREGCREGECGACTVLLGSLNNQTVEYKAVTSCLMPAAELNGKHVVSIEGVSSETLNPVQQIFADVHASQCGFCTPGFIMSLYGFLFNSPDLSESDAMQAIDGNICRCTGYNSIKRAVHELCAQYQAKLNSDKVRLDQLVGWGMLPAYFVDIKARLKVIGKNEQSSSVSLPGSRDEPLIIAGGTDLFIQKERELSESDNVYSLSGYPEMRRIITENRTVTIGAAASIEDIRLDPAVNRVLPGCRDDLKLVSSTILRNRATVGGNIVNASPIADMVIYLLPFSPVLVLENPSGTRETGLRDFYLDYKKTVLKKDEIIRELMFTVPASAAFSFRKSSRRKYLDIAGVNSGFLCTAENGYIKELSVSAGGVAPVPLSLHESCSRFSGKEINKKNVLALCDELKKELKPISDIRGSAAYKKTMFCHQLVDHFASAFPDYLDAEELAGEL